MAVQSLPVASAAPPGSSTWCVVVAFLGTRKTTVEALAADLIAVGERVETGAQALVRSYGAVYQARVRLRIQGPGPAYVRRITGTYWRSIKLEVTPTKKAAIAEVYTEEKRARRLEFGGSGTDSLGRHWRQAPRPHWFADDVLRQTEDQLHAAFAALTENL